MSATDDTWDEREEQHEVTGIMGRMLQYFRGNPSMVRELRTLAGVHHPCHWCATKRAFLLAVQTQAIVEDIRLCQRHAAITVSKAAQVPAMRLEGLILGKAALDFVLWEYQAADAAQPAWYDKEYMEPDGHG